MAILPSAFVPEGHPENSPASQRRERDGERLSPVGTAEIPSCRTRPQPHGTRRPFSRPYGTYPRFPKIPALKRRAFLILSLRNKSPTACPLRFRGSTSILCASQRPTSPPGLGRRHHPKFRFGLRRGLIFSSSIGSVVHLFCPVAGKWYAETVNGSWTVE